MAIPRFRGFRNILAYSEVDGGLDGYISRNHYLDQKVKENFKEMEKARVSYELILFPCQFKDVADILETVPNLVTVINHRGLPKDIEQL